MYTSSITMHMYSAYWLDILWVEAPPTTNLAFGFLRNGTLGRTAATNVNIIRSDSLLRHTSKKRLAF